MGISYANIEDGTSITLTLLKRCLTVLGQEIICRYESSPSNYSQLAYVKGYSAVRRETT